MKKDVPVALVKTWIFLARSDETDQEVKNRALSMLIEAFGTNEKIAIYMKKNNIK